MSFDFNNNVAVIPLTLLLHSCQISRGVNLYFQYNACNSTLHYVCSVKAVDAVGAKYTALFTDCAITVDPEQNIITYNPHIAKYGL